MIGLPQKINWLRFTLDHRKIEDGRLYKDVVQPWQLKIDEAIPNHQVLWITLPRGSGKTDQITWWILLWLMSVDGETAIAAGSDMDNAALIIKSATKIQRLHSPIFNEMDIQRRRITSSRTNSYIEIITSDASSAFGHNASLWWFNDLHSFKSEEFFQNLWSSTGKRPGSRILLESNALSLNAPNFGWLSRLREGLRSNPETFYFQPTNIVPPWQEKAYKEFEKVMHPSAYRRLIENIDTSDQDAFLTQEQVEEVEVLPGISPPLEKTNTIQTTAVDYGVVEDYAVVSTIQIDSDELGPRVRLLRMDALKHASIEEVEKLSLQHNAWYKSYPIVADSWQMKSSIQRFPGLFVEFIPGPAKVQQITQLIRELVINKRISFYKDAGNCEGWNLKKELIRAVIKEMSYGERVDHKSDGYTDRIMSLGMALHNALIENPFPKFKAPPEEPDWNAPIPIKWPPLVDSSPTSVEIGYKVPPTKYNY